MKSSKLPVVFFDFDGVFNWAGASRSKRKKYADAPGYWKKTSIWVDDNKVKGWFEVEWSAELTEKLNVLKVEHPFSWVWLTTWVNHTAKLDQLLDVKSDDTLIWDAYPDKELLKNFSGDITQFRATEKLKTVLDWVNSNPDTPFVWVDDEATSLWTDELDAKTLAPHLIVTPLADYGLVGYELTKITEFITKYSV